MQFLFQPLTWGFLLVLVPVLIHLINLLRQQQVEWAAMEFLLKSYRKHRRWVWLKQLLLLLLRMVAIACAVAMLAGLITQDNWSLLGGQATHHFIVIDDSISMSDRTNEGRAIDRATESILRIAGQLAEQPTAQKVTLLRYSSDQPVLNAQPVDADFRETMEAALRQIDVTELAVDPSESFATLGRLLQNTPDRRRVVYVVSDFRDDPWSGSSLIRESLRQFRQQDADIQLVRCVSAQHQNVALTDLQPEPGTLAAGVPLLVNATVKNFGPQAAQQVSIRLSARQFPSGSVMATSQVVADQVTTVVIEEIAPGESQTRQAQFKFERAGQHVISAELSSDAVMLDNRRSVLVDMPASVPVLLVDGSPQGEEAFYLESVFEPGRVATGIQPVVRPASYLRDVADSEIDRFGAIYIMNVRELDAAAQASVERYVEKGGGVAFFAGPETQPRFLIDWYNEGQGLFPVPVSAARESIRGDDAPDLRVNDHPIFRVLVDEGGNDRPIARGIRVDQHLPIDIAWQPNESPQTEVLATLRGGGPLVVSKPYGQGQVVAFLTTASPTWNNWALGPTYPIVILQLHGYLSASRLSYQSGQTGEPIELQLDASTYEPRVQFELPPATTQAGLESVSSISLAPDADSTQQLLSFTLAGKPSDAGAEARPWTSRHGIYTAQATTLEGLPNQRRFALNVPVADSDLALIAAPELAEQFDDLDVRLTTAAEWGFDVSTEDGFSWGIVLAVLLLLMLLLEQWLAYSMSYHPRKGGVA